MSEIPRHTKVGFGLVDRQLAEAPSNFIAGRPNATLLFGFFGDLRRGVLLFIVISAIYICKK